jgi:hypothetical protein
MAEIDIGDVMPFTMTSYGMVEYDGTPVRDLILRDVPDAPLSEYLVYVMSAYTVYDLQRALDSHEEQMDLPELYPPDALFDPDVHESMEAAIRDLCDEIREATNARVFIATDVNIPTITEVQNDDLDEPGMTPLEQSIAFARESNAVVFVFPYAGIPIGVASEAGALCEHFNLRTSDPTDQTKPRDRFRLFREAGVGSATVEEFEFDYNLKFAIYESREELVHAIKRFLQQLQHREQDDDFPIYWE